MTQSLAMTDIRPAGASTRASFGRRLLLDTTYTVTAVLIAPVAFGCAVAGVAAGLGLLVIGVGLVVLVGTVLVARGLAQVERVRLRSLQGRAAPAPAYATGRASGGGLARLLTPLRDPQSWLDVLWGVVGFVTALVAFVVSASWWAAALGGLTYWFWQRWLPADDVTVVELIGLGEGQGAESVLFLVVGVITLLTVPFVVRACAVAHASVADVLLCSRGALQDEVRRITGSREAARQAAADSSRRLEREIHDGPQQRLVRLTMDLGRVRRQVGDDPDRAVETLDGALRQARETVEELRSLSRGIAPPLLVDRGLRAALEEMLAGYSLPVQSSLDALEELPPHVETTVYFVVAEALTNVVKHSGAARVHVGVVAEGGRVVVRVADDGVGGADPARGHGLSGLRQRLVGVEGDLAIHSPAGGPTSLLATIPLGAPAVGR